jgi:hypothetical protein
MRRTGLRMTPGLGSKNWDMGTETAQANTPTHGYAGTGEDATAAFAKSWRRG